MSGDVRALLKAKAQERSKRITHPLAAYNASGQLRCTLCALIVKDNEVAWSGHLGSKGHRANVGRQKELAEQENERKRLEKGKRKALVDEEDEDDDEMETENVRLGSPNSKRQKTEEEQRPAAAFGSDFFSDPNRKLPTKEEDEEDVPQAKPASSSVPSQIDFEWAQFERDVLASNKNQQDELNRREIYERATIAAEETTSTAHGFPEHLQPSAEAGGAASGRRIGAVIDGEVITELPPEDETPEQARERKEREERELIMDRIMDEERAQEDADEKLRGLKARLALVKQKRAEAKRVKEGTMS
ncbi:hypothetical protein FRC17_006052 [Serendipita sp. 399]|nr:hypothetical protein FRC17_006052 [Serendipita sp. 399]